MTEATPCECGHHRLYHAADGECFRKYEIVKCTCTAYRPAEATEGAG